MNYGKVLHTLSSGGSDIAPIQVLHHVSSYKEQTKPLAKEPSVSPVPITMEPFPQDPIMQTPTAIKQMKEELSNSRKSSSASARELKDRLREELELDPVKTRVVSNADINEKLGTIPIPGMQTTPPTV